jgi:hypothetical protein
MATKKESGSIITCEVSGSAINPYDYLKGHMDRKKYH